MEINQTFCSENLNKALKYTWITTASCAASLGMKVSSRLGVQTGNAEGFCNDIPKFLCKTDSPPNGYQGLAITLGFIYANRFVLGQSPISSTLTGVSTTVCLSFAWEALQALALNRTINTSDLYFEIGGAILAGVASLLILKLSTRIHTNIPDVSI